MSYPTIVIPPRKTSASNLSNDPEIWKAALASPFTHALVGEMIPERSTSYRRRKLGDPATTAPLTPQTPTAFDSLARNLDHCHNLSVMASSESYPKTLTNVHLIPPPSPLSYPTICERISSRMKSGGGSAEIASTAAGMKSTTTQQQQQHVSINKAIQEFQRIQHSSNEAASAISPTAYHSNSNQDQIGVFHLQLPKTLKPSR
ncbi:hypothetical protein BDR26DRAFT_923216 [Obelidium mucronatum]|nr:hypothetical protein BDR26DRAFT_923216 [Obelidium mucronatum]